MLIAGLAGLLAGGFSMALGEWLSVQSSRELYEEQIAVEREELEMAPQEEEAELALIYQAKGLPEEVARRLAAQVIATPEAALDTLAREELGVDPDTLGGSAWEAAFASFLLFCLGAVVPVFPFFFASGPAAVITSLAVSALALFAVGAGITLVTGKSAWRSGLRQTAVRPGRRRGHLRDRQAAGRGHHRLSRPRPSTAAGPPYRALVTPDPPACPRLGRSGPGRGCRWSR